MNKNLLLFSFLLLSGFFGTYAQLQTKTGPMSKNFGPVYPVPEANFRTDKSAKFHAVFDVSRKPADSSRVNPSLETAARYLNLHLQNGFEKQNLKVAMVIHGKAVKDLLLSESYQQEFGIDNPNLPLVRTLIEAGVELVLCGQSSAYHGVQLSETIPGTQMALSAMTALVQLQNEGYRLIHF
ncbi:DsrE family protein [Robertkochia flava]|uniref:DsrE family protein n=1 Tax=Robertkochia flava TaxID=3447986 RepID=UPI001CCE4803|nr:DsrE family protein [Robertkochia marina]